MELGVAQKATSLTRRLAWITGLRLGFLVLFLGATAFLYLRGDLSSYPVSIRILMGTIGGGFVVAGVYAALLRAGRRLDVLAYAQIALDQITWTAIVYVSGGATSGATSLYALTCLVGAIVIGLRGAAFAALTGLSLYALLCVSFWLGWVQPPGDQSFASYAVTAPDLVYPLLVNALGIVVVSLLAGYLAERLRLTGGALEVATARAFEAERLAALGKLAAGLAHEIRNPLGSIRGSIEMLRESPELTEDDKHLCDIIHREAQRLNNLVGDMMDLAKPRVPRPESVDVSALAQEVVELANHSERGGDVAVEYVGPAKALARCDGAQIRQVVWNLVRNAIQVSAAGSRVVVRVQVRGPELSLAVEDRGPGISDEQKAKIFDAFFTTRTHGTGIGLAVVKRIIDDHASMGARIRVESPAGGGARFEISLSTDVAGLRASLRPPPLVAPR